MATYAYEQTIAGDSSIGYIKYNITPDFSDYIVPGQAIRIQGVAYCKYYSVNSIRAIFRNPDNYSIVGMFSSASVDIPKGKKTSFDITITAPLVNSSMPEGRYFQESFRLCTNGNNGGDVLYVPSGQEYMYVKYRLVKEIQIDFARYAIIDGAYKQVNDGTLLIGNIKMKLHEEATIEEITKSQAVVTPGVEYPSDFFDIAKSVAIDAITEDGYAETEPFIFADYEFLAARTYEISIGFGDEITLTSVKMNIPAATAAAHIPGNNKGFAVGGFSSATEDEPKFESYWPAFLYGGLGGNTANIVASQVFDIMAHWIWPVGCLYFDAEGFGPPPWIGVWERIESGRFIVSAEDDEGTGKYKPGSTGGAESANISVAAHKHTISTQENVKFVSGAVTSGSYDIPITGTSNAAGAIDVDIPTIPPYLAVTIWKRVE